MPKGPSYDPAEKRMAIHVEDDTLSYSSFEETIPPKQYTTRIAPAIRIGSTCVDRISKFATKAFQWATEPHSVKV